MSVVVEVEEFLSMDRDLILIKVIFEAEWVAGFSGIERLLRNHKIGRETAQLINHN